MTEILLIHGTIQMGSNMYLSLHADNCTMFFPKQGRMENTEKGRIHLSVAFQHWIMWSVKSLVTEVIK